MRIKTMRFRGVLSQGLFLPLTAFTELNAGALTVGDDVTELLRVRKWEIPEIVGTGAGTCKGIKPYGIPTTDETRIQSAERYLDQLSGSAYFITTKIDGSSCTMYYKDGDFGVCGRNYEYVDDSESPMWKYAHKLNIPEKMKKLGRNLAIQGEFCGEGFPAENFIFYGST